MSRTYKDRPVRVKFPDTYWKTSKEYESVPYIRVGRHYKTGEQGEWLGWYSVKKPYIRLKRPKHLDVEWHWVHGTPSWWTNMFMNRPQRIASKRWEREVVNEPLWAVYEGYVEEPPSLGKKPHVYYW